MEENRADKSHLQDRTSKRAVYFILGILETLFAFRLIFKLLGANPSSAFVSFIYALTGLFLNPFRGIFPSAVGEGITTHSVLEPSVIIGMIVYALIAYGIVVLIDMAANRKKRTE